MKVFRLIVLILHLGILFMLLGTLMNAYIPPKIFPWFNLLSLGFPVLIAAYIICTLFWLFSWKKRTFAFMLIGLAFISPVKRWINYSSDKKVSSDDIKVVTFNIKAGLLGAREIEQYLNRIDADVILIQEEGREAFTIQGMSKAKIAHNNGVLAFYSRHRIIETKSLIEGNYDLNNAYGTQADIEIRGKVYRFVNVYLEPYKFDKSMVKMNGDKEQDERRLRDIVKKLIPVFKKHQDQVSEIRTGIDQSPYPVFLAGDFNSVPNSYEYYHLSEGLEDAFMKAGKGSATSFHDYRFPIRIDYIFTSKSIRPVSYKVDRTIKLSDHYPVVATFSVNN
ncbi:endonuclease/exonuclease/phosphatase family protein [Chryseobacterium indologenes]|nr:endonuclease/exonuclease/phosphatase family protein [Chryseobacterium indologenes]